MPFQVPATVGERLEWLVVGVYGSLSSACTALNRSRTFLGPYVRNEYQPGNKLRGDLRALGFNDHWIMTGEGEYFLDTPEGRALRAEWERRQKLPALSKAQDELDEGGGKVFQQTMEELGVYNATPKKKRRQRRPKVVRIPDVRDASANESKLVLDEFEMRYMRLSTMQMVGAIGAGSVGEDGNQENPIPLNEDLGLPEISPVVIVKGKSMEGADLYDGDRVIIMVGAPHAVGDLVAVQVGNNGRWIIKRFTSYGLVSEYRTGLVRHHFEEETTVRGVVGPVISSRSRRRAGM